MDGVEIIVPLSFFIFLAAIILVPGYLRSRERGRMHETLRIAYEKGQPVPPEMIEALQMDRRKAPQPDRDLRRGIILLCLAAAIVVFALTMGEFQDPDANSFAAVAAFPGFIGLGYIAFWLASRRKSV